MLTSRESSAALRASYRETSDQTWLTPFVVQSVKNLLRKDKEPVASVNCPEAFAHDVQDPFTTAQIPALHTNDRPGSSRAYCCPKH